MFIIYGPYLSVAKCFFPEEFFHVVEFGVENHLLATDKMMLEDEFKMHPCIVENNQQKQHYKRSIHNKMNELESNEYVENNNWTYTQGDLSSRHFIELMSPQSPAMSFLDFLLMRHDVVGGCESLGENFGAKGFESVSAAYLTQLGVHAGFSLVCRQHVATDWMLAHTYNTLGEMHERMVTVLISDSLLTSRKKLTKVAAECGFGVAHHEEMDHDFLQNLIRHPRLAQCVNAIIPDGIHCVDQGIEYLRNATVSLNEFHNNRTSRLDAVCRAIHNAPRFHQKTAMLTAHNELFCNQVFYQEVKKFNQLLAPYLKSDDANAFALKNYLKRCLNTFGLSDLEKVFQSMHFLSLHFSKLDKAPLIFSEFANISTAKCVSNFLGVPAVVEDVKNAVSKIKQWLQRLLPWYVRTSDDGVFYVEVNHHFHQI